MCRFYSLLFFFCGVVVSLGKPEQDISISSYISPSDKIKLKQVFEDAWKLEDLGILHYAISSYRILNDELPVPLQEICDFVKKTPKSASLEAFYHATSIIKEIPSCSSSQLVNDAGSKLLEITQKENVVMEELYYTVSTLSNLKSNTSDVSFIIKSMRNTLKSNETLLNLGYALHVGVILPKKEMESLFDKIDSIISQADEVDGRYLQFEGGLTITALIIDGIYKISEKLNKPPSLTNSQLIKFANYLISRNTVSRPRGVYGLLQVLRTLSDNSFHAYVSVGQFQDPAISKAQPVITLRVSDIFGQPLFKSDSSPLTITLVSVTKKGGSATAVSGNKFEATSDRTKYTLNSASLNLTPGYYKLSVSVAHPKTKKENRIIVNSVHNDIPLKLTTTLQIENFQIGIHNTEHSSSPSLNKLEYPKQLSGNLNIDTLQRLMIKFSLKDIDYNTLSKVQQSFVKLINRDTKKETTFVCQSDSNHNFKLNMDLSNIGSNLGYASGTYEVVVIVADSLVSPSIQWNVADVNLKFVQDHIPEQNEDVANYYLPKPEIKHLFREPEKRPPYIVSNIFTGLALLPLFILLCVWFKLGANVKNFPFSFGAIGFHAGLGGIFTLFVIFWLQLNMFETIKYLLVLGAVTFVCGYHMLSDIANRSKK